VPRLLPIDPHHPDPATVQAIVEVLEAGGLVALPTDTVYGLAADGSSVPALERLQALKARPHDKPLPIFIAGLEMLGTVARDIPNEAVQLARRFWPGPLTLILYASPEVPEAITAGTGTVGVRIPKLPLIEAVLASLGRPITGTSANRSGGKDPVVMKDVRRALGKGCDLFVDGGRAPGKMPSTVLDCTGPQFRIIRQGALGAEALAAVVGSDRLLSA
jgi:L-threonylcarbamoyladenylate synthase